jgi:hypothetical protein
VGKQLAARPGGGRGAVDEGAMSDAMELQPARVVSTHNTTGSGIEASCRAAQVGGLGLT